VDPWDAAGVVEDLLASAAGDRSFRREASALAGLHPGRSVTWRDDAGRAVAWAGPVHPELAARLGLQAELLLGEADLTAAASEQRPAAVYRPISRLPGTWRDLSLVLDGRSSAGSIVAALKKVASPAPVELVWIDRYSGPPLKDGEVAMTLRVMLQPLDRTLTDGDAETYRAALVAALDSVPGARLRRVDP
jgi:phenylalanyl-tRNA synthetase beta chain